VKFLCSFVSGGCINESRVMKSHTVIVCGPFCPFMSSNVCFMKLDSLIFGTYIFKIISSDGLFLANSDFYCCYSCLLSDSICLEYYSQSFHFESGLSLLVR
jgi:hypothetical protein